MNIEALLEHFKGFRALSALSALEGTGGAAAASRCRGHSTFFARNPLPYCLVRTRDAATRNQLTSYQGIGNQSNQSNQNNYGNQGIGDREKLWGCVCTRNSIKGFFWEEDVIFRYTAVNTRR